MTSTFPHLVSTPGLGSSRPGPAGGVIVKRLVAVLTYTSQHPAGNTPLHGIRQHEVSEYRQQHGAKILFSELVSRPQDLVLTQTQLCKSQIYTKPPINGGGGGVILDISRRKVRVTRLSGGWGGGDSLWKVYSFPNIQLMDDKSVVLLIVPSPAQPPQLPGVGYRAALMRHSLLTNSIPAATCCTASNKLHLSRC